MRVRVLCKPGVAIPTLPGGVDIFPINAESALDRLGVVNPTASAEPGCPIYGEADRDTFEAIQLQLWVERATATINPADW